MKMKKKLEKMMIIISSLLVLLLHNVVVVVAAAAASSPSLSSDDMIRIWPMPMSATHGQGSVCVGGVGVGEGLKLVIDDNIQDQSILTDAFKRMLDDLLPHSDNFNYSSSSASTTTCLQAIHVTVLSPHHQQLQYGVDESYKLLVPSPIDPTYALLEANTVYGALHGFQTFSQLLEYNFGTRMMEVRMAPWTIIDQPRFPYRGLLIDTSRHYQPIRVIKKVIDSMAYAKLNVLHWHIEDTQSFPLEIPSFPKLWDGAYSPAERYTMADAADIVSYAQRRGINVLAEIDIPGHALSWGVGYPSLWPSKDCQQPLDVSSEFTFKVIDGILSDFSKVFPFKFVHLGGDEVNTSCWTSTPRIKKWLKQKGMTESQAYQYFVLRGQQIALKHGYEIVNWEETFNNFGDKLSRKTVVHNWLGSGVAKEVVAAGLRCIVSNQDKWYLDHVDTPWQDFYTNEPLTNITDPAKQKLVLGGEVCMWGEVVDASDIEQTIWPRAAAAAERLWTPFEKLAKDPEQVAGRLAKFRCLLNQRGVAAAPLYGLGRGIPDGPGSCYLQ